MNTFKSAVLRFINESGINEYTSVELQRAIENMGYAIIKVSPKERPELFNIKNTEQDFFLFDNGVLKYIVISDAIEENDKCFVLSKAAAYIYLSVHPALTKNRNITYKELALSLKDTLSNKGLSFRLHQHIFEYICVFATTAAVIFFCFYTVFLEKSMKREISMPEFEQTKEFSNNAKTNTTELEDIIPAFNTINADENFDLGITETPDEITESVSDDEINTVQKDTTVYYVTKSGTKYHIEGCSYIKDLSTCKTLKYDELCEYQPCKRCIK